MEISIENLSFVYNKSNQEIFRNINLKFQTGKLYVIFGPSGSGKTTFLNIMGGMEYGYTGKILFDNKDIREIDRAEFKRKMVSTVFQNYNLFDSFSALENLKIAVSIYGKEQYADSKKLQILLERLGLSSDKHNRKVSMLSGGEQQRIAIARSIVSDAPVILADEPTGNLDYYNSEVIKKVLKSMAEKMNRCVIVVTHNESFKELADCVLHLDSRNHTLLLQVS